VKETQRRKRGGIYEEKACDCEGECNKCQVESDPLENYSSSSDSELEAYLADNMLHCYMINFEEDN